MRHISTWLAPAAEWASTKSQRHLHSRAQKDRAEWNTPHSKSSAERIYDYWQIMTPCKQINAEKKWMLTQTGASALQEKVSVARAGLCVFVRCDACNNHVVLSYTNQQKVEFNAQDYYRATADPLNKTQYLQIYYAWIGLYNELRRWLGQNWWLGLRAKWLCMGIGKSEKEKKTIMFSASSVPQQCNHAWCWRERCKDYFDYYLVII